MSPLSRRKFLRTTAFAGIGSAIGSAAVLSAPSILTRPRTTTPTAGGELIFRPHYVQRGRGPHLLEWAYASDEKWDAFHSNISSTREGVSISDTEGKEKFGINVRWNVEGFGYIFITADNEGEFYRLPAAGKTMELNLNFELAKSRVARNRRRLRKHESAGWVPSREVRTLMGISQNLLEDAAKTKGDEVRRGELSQQSLFHAM